MPIINWTVDVASLEELVKWVGVALDVVKDDTEKNRKETRKEIFNVLPTENAIVNGRDVSWVDGLDKLLDWDDVAAWKEYLWNKYAFEMEEFAKTLKITKNALMDREQRWKQKLDEMKKLLVEWYNTLEKSAYAVFNNAFSATTTETIWTKVFTITKPENITRLCSTVQPLANWSTFSNALEDSDALSPASVEKMIERMLWTVWENWALLDMWMTYTLVVPRQLLMLAKRIVGSEKLQWGNDNDVNTLQWVKVHLNPYATSATAYFLVANENNWLTQYVREDVSTARTTDVQTDLSIKEYVWTRFASWFTTFRWVIGSKWDGSTYTN